MGALFGGLFKLLAGDAGASIGRGISLAVAIPAIVAGVTVAVGHKDELAVSLTWGQLALFAGFAWSIVEVARRARPPGGPQLVAGAIAGLLALVAPDPAIAAAGADPLTQIQELMRLVAWLQTVGLTALLWFVWFQWKLERRVYRLELHNGIAEVKT